ncbi:MAG: choice-of-anchor B family protein [Saprospiraceae bacterium]|nr:choice-of-anchor B family protein [Saprospiraceae bacterium]
MKKILLTGILCVSVLSIRAQVVQAELLGRWYREDLVGSSLYNNTYNDVWGLAVNGREYAVIGSTAGTHFIDVTNPTELEEVAFVPGAAQGGQIIHRDFKNYGCYLYGVCDEGASTLQIMDVSYLPDSVHLVYNTNESLVRSHNIFVDTTNAVLYCFAAFGGPAATSAMRVYSLANPELPEFIGEYNNFGMQVGHVHDGYVRDGIAYLNCGYSGFAIVDFTNPYQPVTLSTLTDYPFSGYNHSCWGSSDGDYLYMADENHGYKIKALRVSDPTNIEVVATFDAESNSSMSIPHNQLVACNYLYVSYYYDGLQVYDISDPADPHRVMQYATSTLANNGSYAGAWGVYPFLPSGNILVSDMQNGLYVVAGPSGECEDKDVTILDCQVATSTRDIAVVQDWQLYPQPAQDQLDMKIYWGESQQMVKFCLVDITGRVVTRFEDQALSPGENAIRLELPETLPAGMYAMQLQSESGTAVRKALLGGRE